MYQISKSEIFEEAFNMLCDNLIGEGVHRQVYQCRLMPDAVVKVEKDNYQFTNIREYQVWEAVKDHKVLGKMFAPVLHISPDGKLLIMKRTSTAYVYPDKLPVCMQDTKAANYGMLDGRFVCHDYGLNGMLEHGMSTRLRKVNWY